MRRHFRDRGRACAARRDSALQRGVKAALVSVILWSVQGGAFGADDFIVLEESQIFGKGPLLENPPGAVPAELPALSTSFPWEGEEKEIFNIPEEILNDLTQPDLSYLSGEAIESNKEEEEKGE